MNRSNASRVVSKQECVVELLGLPLVLCTEEIENVSISGAMKITVQPNQSAKNFLNEYRNRPEEHEDKTLCEFFHLSKNNRSQNHSKIVIPHFIGIPSNATYPPNASYARSVLTVHTPWRKRYIHLLTDDECISEFYSHMKNKSFPRNVVLTYNRLKIQYKEKRLGREPVASNEAYDNVNKQISPDDEIMIRTLSSIASNMGNTINISGMRYERGLTYSWDEKLYKVSKII